MGIEQCHAVRHAAREMDAVPLGTVPDYQSLVDRHPGATVDALVAIREQRVRDYATRHDKKADACKDEAVALFAAGSSVEQICAQLSLWPLKVLKVLVTSLPAWSPVVVPVPTSALWRIATSSPWALLQLADERDGDREGGAEGAGSRTAVGGAAVVGDRCGGEDAAVRSDGEAGVVGDRCWGEDAAVRSDGGAMAGGQKHRRDEQRKALERLVQELVRFELEERKYSTRAREYSSIIGQEYEAVLYAKMRNMGLHFKTEADLRWEGSNKTPDALLTVPVMVRGRVVHWIDSKAMYGDATAWKYAREQVDHYVACFGTGMVIFWFGADDDVGDLAGPSVLVLGSFPKGEEVTMLQTEIVDVTALAAPH